MLAELRVRAFVVARADLGQLGLCLQRYEANCLCMRAQLWGAQVQALRSLGLERLLWNSGCVVFGFSELRITDLMVVGVALGRLGAGLRRLGLGCPGWCVRLWDV